MLLALVAFGAVFLLGNLGGGAAIGGPSTTVVVAKQAIPLRHQITEGDLDTAKISLSGNANAANIYANPKDVVNLIAEINISKGSVITSDMLAKDINLVPAGSAPAFLPLAKGYVAMTIPTGEQQGVAGHISVGDYVTVIVSGAVTIFASKGAAPGGGTGVTKVVSKTVFTNVRVIGLGPAAANVQSATSSGAGGQGAATTGVTSSLTVEITQCDAEYLVWFLNNTQVRYTLESFKDYGTAPADNQDPACPQITAAGGVTQTQVDARWHFSSL